MKKMIVLTGASSHFGMSLVKKLSQEGHQIAATMRETSGKNKQIAGELAALENVEVFDLDVEQEASIKVTFEQIFARYQHVDVLINNASIKGIGILEAYSIDQFHRMMNVNVYGILRIYHKLLPEMRRAQNGLIINISGSNGRYSPPFQVPFNASKFALEALTEGGYDELISQGIETVLVEPGAFFEGMNKREHVDANRAGVLESYGSQTSITMASYGYKLGAALQKYQPEVGGVINAVLNLLDMEKGTRPLRTSIDEIAQGADIAYNQEAQRLKKQWAQRYIE